MALSVRGKSGCVQFILGVHLEFTQPKVVVTYRPEPIVAELTEHTESTASSMSEVFDLDGPWVPFLHGAARKFKVYS